MRIEQSGQVTTLVAARADDVLAVLSDPVEVADFVSSLVAEGSTTKRWVVEPVRVGPVVVRPVTAVHLERERNTVRVVGVPVPLATPTWLDVAMTTTAVDARTRVDAQWRVRVELHGPQFVARLARPLLDQQTRFVSAELTRALVERFR